MNSKAAIIKAINHITKHESFKENQLVLLTSFGIVKGTLVESDPDNFANEDLMSVVYDAYREAALKKDHDIYPAIPLKNVTVIHSMNFRSNYETLLVFPDQVIGVTIGKDQS